MATVIPTSEFGEVLLTAKHTWFRLEMQPAYDVGKEIAESERFAAGKPLNPHEEKPIKDEWLNQVRAWRDAGIRIERVRVHEDPPTDYQRWVRWTAAWNIAAGEVMRYMTRKEAHDVGLLPAAGDADWYLLDSNRLLKMHFDSDHRIFRVELDDDPATVVQACAWRDLAIHYSHPETLDGIAAQILTP